MTKKIIGGLIGISLLFFVVDIFTGTTDPQYKLEGMCKGYYKMLNEKGVADISEDQYKGACAASWEAMSAVLSEEDLLIYYHYTFKYTKEGASTDDTRRISGILRKAAFAGSCAWSQENISDPTQREVFCAATGRFGMFL